MIETLSVSALYLRNLIEDSLKLNALLNAGVDNWEGYSEVDWPTRAEVDKEVQDVRENPA